MFDRLNRNGEPLNPQELRNAKYSTTPLLKLIKELSNISFLQDKRERLKIERMEDEEFVSDKCIWCGKPAKHMAYWGKSY